MPDGVHYGFGDRGANQLASVARWLVRAKAAAPNAHGEIKAVAKTPFHEIAKLLAEFRRAGYAHVDFFSTAIPDAAVRAARRMPYPASDEPEQREFLVFRLAEGDARDLDRASEIAARRLVVAGLGILDVRRENDTLLITRPRDPSEVATVREIIERKGATLEFHLTVEPDSAGYDEHWKRLKQVLDNGGEPGDAGPGLKWYRLSDRARASYVKNRLPEEKQPYVLCKRDEFKITGASIENVACRRNSNTLEDNWIIVFDVRKSHQANMARLTREEGAYLAIVLNGEVDAAPVLNSPVRSSAQISGAYSEQEARSLAALLATEPLPVRLAMER